MIVTLPVPVAETFADEARRTPREKFPLPHEVPLTAIEPELAVMMAPDALMP